MREVLYFDNAATSWPKPPQVGEAIVRFLAHDAANPGRGGHRMALAAQRVVDESRQLLARLINAPDPSRLALTMGATDAINFAIHGVIQGAIEAHPRVRPHVVSTVIEHNAVTRSLNELHRRGAIDLTIVGIDAQGLVSADEVLAATTERTALVSVMHASNVTGAIQPVEAIAGRLRRQHPSALLFVDTAQTVGLLPVDVQTLGADLIAFPGHKSLLGPTGVGALWVGPRAYDESRQHAGMVGYRQGGTGGDSGRPIMPSSLPRHFESGTPNTVGWAGMVAALKHGPPPRAALAHERSIAQRIRTGVAELPGATIYGPADPSLRLGVVTFNLEGIAPREVGGILDASFNIATRPGLHCAPGAHEALGTAPDGSVRVSPGPYTTDAEVDALLEALGEIASGAGRRPHASGVKPQA